MNNVSRVAVARLKSTLSSYLARVKSGESFIITDRGTGVAVLAPIVWRPEGDSIDALVMSGQVAPPSDELGDEFFLKERTVKDPAGKLRAFLEEDRSGGW